MTKIFCSFLNGQFNFTFHQIQSYCHMVFLKEKYIEKCFYQITTRVSLCTQPNEKLLQVTDVIVSMRTIVFFLVCLTKFQAYFMLPPMCFSVSPLRLPMKSCSSLLLQHFSWVTFESSLQLIHASSLILLPKVTPLPFAIITSGYQACAFFMSNCPFRNQLT